MDREEEVGILVAERGIEQRGKGYYVDGQKEIEVKEGQGLRQGLLAEGRLSAGGFRPADRCHRALPRCV